MMSRLRKSKTRWWVWSVLGLSSCSFDWSLASGGTGGNSGTAGSSAGGATGGSATGGTATGGTVTGGASSGGTGGTAVGGGGASGPLGGSGGTVPVVCGTQECLGKPCGAQVVCDSGKATCCLPADQTCAHAPPPPLPGNLAACVPTGCFKAAGVDDAGSYGELRCIKECPDLCASLGLVCCPATGLCSTTTNCVGS
jgi:hypothetical protein